MKKSSFSDKKSRIFDKTRFFSLKNRPKCAFSVQYFAFVGTNAYFCSEKTQEIHSHGKATILKTQKNDILMALNIKSAIALRGLTATQVAERMGISISTLSAIVNGNPMLSSLEGVAKALRCDVAELFDRPPAWCSKK